MATQKINIRKELANLEKLRDALLAEESRQTDGDRIREMEGMQPHVEPGTPEMEALLASGYNMSIETAQRIIQERDADPQRWPLERYENAQAMIAAYNAKAEVISNRPGWHRTRGR